MSVSTPSRPAPALRAAAGVVVAALGLALLLRACVAEAFRIPSPSMEGTLLVGDHVLVSKVHYGARLPETLRLPFSERHWAGPVLPGGRLPGLRPIRRGDVIVFHHPAEAGPVDARTLYVKRVVGLPGDTVALAGKELFVNGRPWPVPSGRHDWVVTLAGDGEAHAEELAHLRPVERAGLRAWRVRASTDEAAALAARPAVVRVEPAPGRPDGALFPPGTPYTPDDYGPVVVPRAGTPFRITDANWPAVRVTLEREGRHAARLGPGRYEIDGAVTDVVYFQQDYYFVLGDNRDASADSRRWGFVPADHVVGKAVAVYFSWDPEAARPRLGRTGRIIR